MQFYNRSSQVKVSFSQHFSTKNCRMVRILSESESMLYNYFTCIQSDKEKCNVFVFLGFSKGLAVELQVCLNFVKFSSRYRIL